MNPTWLGSVSGDGSGQRGDGAGRPWEGRPRPDLRRERRRMARVPYEMSQDAQSSQRRIRRENQRELSLRMACTLRSVTSLTPCCGPELLLTKYQRLSQLVRYTAFLEDATSALVRELGVRLNFDFSPVTRYIRRLRYQSQSGAEGLDCPAEEADEVLKLLDSMSAGSGEQRTPTAGSSWSNRNASSTAPGPSAPPPRPQSGGFSGHDCLLPN